MPTLVTLTLVLLLLACIALLLLLAHVPLVAHTSVASITSILTSATGPRAHRPSGLKSGIISTSTAVYVPASPMLSWPVGPAAALAARLLAELAALRCAF